MTTNDTSEPTGTTPERRVLICSEPGWPSIELELPDTSKAIDNRLVYKAMKKLFAEQESPYTVIGHSRSILFPDGVLEVPILLAHEDKGIAVYIFPDGEPVDAGYFAGVQKLLTRDDYLPPVYYAPTPLPPSRPLDPLRPFALDVFRDLPSNQAPQGTYAMWWPTPDEAHFCNTTTYDYIARIYQAMNGIESYFVAKFLRYMGMLPVGADPSRVPLTGKPWIVPVVGPETVPLYFVADDQRGIQFYLHADLASREYRELFWKHLLTYTERERERLTREGAPLDSYPEDASNPLNWWLLAERTVQMRESQGATMEYFGGLEALMEDGELDDEDDEEEVVEPLAEETVVAPQPQQKSPNLAISVIVVLIVVWTIILGYAFFGRDGDSPEPAQPGGAAGPPPAKPVAITDAPDAGGADPATATPAATTPGTTAPGETAPVEPVAATTTAPTTPEAPAPTVPEAPAEAVDQPPPAETMTEAPAPTRTGLLSMQDKPVLPVLFTRPISYAEVGAATPTLLVVERDTIRLWDIRRRTVVRSLSGSVGALSGNGQQVATYLRGTNGVTVSQVSNGYTLNSLRPVSQNLTGMQFSGDGALLLTIGESLKVWNLQTGKPLFELAVPEGLRTARLSPDGSLLALSTPAGLQVILTADGKAAHSTEWPDAGAGALAFSGDGTQLGVVNGKSLVVFTVADWQRRDIPFDKHPMVDIALDATGGIIAAVSGVDELSLWTATSDSWLTYQTPAATSQVFFTPEGTAVGARLDRRVLLWELKSLLPATP